MPYCHRRPSTTRFRQPRYGAGPYMVRPFAVRFGACTVRLWCPYKPAVHPSCTVTARSPTGLALLVNLKCLIIGFESPLSRPERKNQSPSPPTLTVLPALTRYELKGASEYLEEFVARIDAPLLNSISITFFHQVVFDLPRVAQFMGRITRFQELKEAHLLIAHGDACVDILPPATRTSAKMTVSYMAW